MYKVGFFARGEFYSYAPMIHYNEDGPRIGKGDALSGSLGHALTKGPVGRFDPTGYYYWGIWNFLEQSLGSESAPRVHLEARGAGKVGHGECRLRHPAFQELVRL